MMVTAIIQRSLAVLALAAVVITVWVAILAVRRRVPAWLRDDVCLPLAAAIAIVATAGSLYMSEVAGYLPCALCWYQRIAMYPLVIVLVVAAVRRDQAVWLTAVPLAVAGSAVAFWHIAIERNPRFGGTVCDPVAPCAIKWVNEFGFLTLPTMALIGFVAIAILTIAARQPAGSEEASSRRPQHGSPPQQDMSVEESL